VSDLTSSNGGQMTEGAPPTLQIDNVVKRFGQRAAVDDVTLTINRREFVTILGASGSGKSTLLRIIAGHEDADEGRICLSDRDISTLSPGERGIGMVFQHYALFPHMTVASNVAYPLKRRRWEKDAITARVSEILALVDLPGYDDRFPRQLSGGQQQRVALARALAFKPTLLLMDEPLGALDRQLRARMVEEVKRIHRESDATVVYVTHDQEEALALSDRIGIFHEGRLVQIGTPEDLWLNPASSYVATFFGDCVLMPATFLDDEPGTAARVRILGQELVVRSSKQPTEEKGFVAVRPGRFHLTPSRNQLTVQCTVEELLVLGESVRVVCEAPTLGRFVIRLQESEARSLRRGDTVALNADVHDCPFLAQ